MKSKRFLLAVLVLALVLSAGVGSAWAYFSANASAEGGRTIHVGGGTKIDEYMANWTKHITITYDDTKGSQPVFIRAKVYDPGTYLADITTEVTGTGWELHDGYYYYTKPLSPENPDAGELDVAITVTGQPDYDTFIDEYESFTVTVVYESAQVLYGEDGKLLDPWAEDVWKQTITRTEETFKPGENSENDPAESSPEGGE